MVSTLMPPVHDRFWFALYTSSKKEKFVNNLLVNSGIETFFPTQKVVRQWSDRKKKIEVPLFFNYIFVKIKKNEKGKVLSVPGATRIVGNKYEASIVPEREIDAIKKMLDLDNLEVADHCFKEGDETVVLSGPFKGLQGVLINANGRNRVAIRLTSIQRAIILNINPNFIQKQV